MQLESGTLRCSSCGARCEPTRSFCRRCGSAVFVDDASYARLRQIPTLDRDSADPTRLADAAKPVPQAVRRAVRRTRAQQPAVPAAAAAGAGCVGSLVRWAVFVGIAYYALNAFGLWPDVRSGIGALVSGDRSGLAPIVERLRTLGGNTEAPSGDSGERATGIPADTELVTPPRVTSRVAARYPAEAFARGIQGTVVLRVTVEPDGAVSDVEVIRSVDTQYGIDDAAVTAVRGWTFEPGRRGDERVRLATTVSVRFATAQTPARAPAPR